MRHSELYCQNHDGIAPDTSNTILRRSGSNGMAIGCGCLPYSCSAVDNLVAPPPIALNKRCARSPKVTAGKRKRKVKSSTNLALEKVNTGRQKTRKKALDKYRERKSSRRTPKTIKARDEIFLRSEKPTSNTKTVKGLGEARNHVNNMILLITRSRLIVRQR